MSAFDFGNLSERRRIERQAKQRKRIAVGLSIALVLAVIVACGALAVLHQTRHSSSSHKSSSSSSSSSSSGSKSSKPSSAPSDTGGSGEGEGVVVGDGIDVATSSKAIKAMCQPTDYKDECEKTLTEAAGKNHTVDPKDLLRASIEAVADELKKGFAHAAMVHSQDPMVKNAILDCEELAAHAETELKNTVRSVVNDDLEVAAKSPELKNWMSAVMSYQQTCMDGFPEGDMKNQMKEAMETSKRMTSNALAIIEQVASILSGLGLTGLPKRRLLEQFPLLVKVPHDLPEWISHEGKRLLAEKAKPKPDAVVAQDGSGDFKTITAALEAMPKDRKGRCARCKL